MGSEHFIPAEGPGTKGLNKAGSRGFIGVQLTNLVWAKGRGEYKWTNQRQGERKQGGGGTNGVSNTRELSRIDIYSTG